MKRSHCTILLVCAVCAALAAPLLRAADAPKEEPSRDALIKRIAELEKRVADLEARLRKLEPKAAPEPAELDYTPTDLHIRVA